MLITTLTIERYSSSSSSFMVFFFLHLFVVGYYINHSIYKQNECYLHAFIYFHSILYVFGVYLDIFYVDIIFLGARWKRRYRLSGGNRISVDNINSMVLYVCWGDLKRWYSIIGCYVPAWRDGILWYSYMRREIF